MQQSQYLFTRLFIEWSVGSQWQKRTSSRFFHFFSWSGRSDSDRQPERSASSGSSDRPQTSSNSTPISSTSTEAMPSTSSSKRIKCKHDKFRESWLKDFRWLEVDANDEMTMYCKVCIKTKQKSGLTRGSRNFQYFTLADHAKSVSHKAAVATDTKQASMVPHSEAARPCWWKRMCESAVTNFDSLWIVLAKIYIVICNATGIFSQGLVFLRGAEKRSE